MDGPVQPNDLVVVVVDEVTENSQSVSEGVGQLEGVELGCAALAPHVVTHGKHAVLGHDRMRLRLDASAQVGELGPEADQLPKLPRRRWSDPRLG